MKKHEPCYLIANIGLNHNGNYELAIKLINQAKKYGFNAIVFQIFKTNYYVSKKAKTVKYQKENTHCKKQYKMLKKVELHYDILKKIKKHCDQINIEFIASPCDKESVYLSKSLYVDIYKINSEDITNHQLLKYVAKQKKYVILSTGMSTIEEIKEAVEYLHYFGCTDIILLHSVFSYPLNNDNQNLLCITTLQKEFPDILIGYSDHSLCNQAAIMAITLGAVCIEKAITLSHDLEGCDHKTSLDVSKESNFISDIRHAELLLGDGEKKYQYSELENRLFLRRSLAVKYRKHHDEIIHESDLICLRPDTGIPAKYYDNIIGKRLKKGKHKYDLLQWDDFYHK